jgi:hypothetical protein
VILTDLEEETGFPPLVAGLNLNRAMISRHVVASSVALAPDALQSVTRPSAPIVNRATEVPDSSFRMDDDG